jgi:Mlc titration factor MtfA (ptsG expression regulator)
VIAAAAVAVLLALILPPVRRAKHRRAAREQPLPEAWAAAIDRNVPVRKHLPADLRQRHDGLINAFVAEKQFVGCNGLLITDEIRTTVAAQACLLVLGRPGTLYDDLMSILVYPTAFWVEDEVHDEDGLVTQRRRVLSGEAWDSHRIVLSWEDVTDIAASPIDGFNLVLHEFAHYLEAEGRGLAPSLPLPLERERSRAARVRASAARGRTSSDRVRALEDWSGDLAAEFDRLLDAVDRGEATFLDPYAAEDEAEFFAVATEDFYERSRELLAAHPRLYGLLREFYGVDPAAWVNAS